jgi:hypothetical protein
MSPQSSVEQIGLAFGAMDGGSYEVGGKTATWRCRGRDSNIIDLNFDGREFKVTQESTGPQGRPRLLINGFTQPDGKLLQGRSLPELIRTLWLQGDKIVARLNRVEARVDRIEKAIRIKSTRPRLSSKLCAVPVVATWPEARYVPAGAPGGFSRVPLPLIPASQYMALGEYRLLQVILNFATGTGLWAVGKVKLAERANIDQANVRDFRDSLCNRGIMRPTGVIKGRGCREYELLTHPWLVGDRGNEMLPLGDREPPTGGTNGATGGTVPPIKTSNQNPDKTIKKTPKPLLALSAEEELLGRIARVCGMGETVRSGGMWRNWMREPKKLLAIRFALEDFEAKTPEQKAQFGNKKGKGAALNDLVQRRFEEISAKGENKGARSK